MELPKSLFFDSYAFGVRALCAHVRLILLSMICAVGTFGALTIVLGTSAIFLSRGDVAERAVQEVYARKAEKAIETGRTIKDAELKPHIARIRILNAMTGHLPGSIQHYFRSLPDILIVLFALILLLYGLYALVGCMRISLDLCDTGSSHVARLFTSPILFLKILALIIVALPFVLLGFTVFVIPGIILMIRFSLSMWLIIDKRIGIFKALSRSMNLSRNFFWELAAIAFVSSGLSALPSFALKAFGLTATYLAFAFMYRTIVKQALDKDPTLLA